MPTRRQERVAKRIVQELVEALRNLKQVNLGFITITRCDITPDLRHAKVFYSVWGGEEEQGRCRKLLGANARVLRRMVGRPLGLKTIPDLEFEFDTTLEAADRINRIIREARQTDLNPEPLTPEEEAALIAQAELNKPAVKPAGGGDLFDEARRDVEEELLDDEDDFADPAWTPIDLDKLPEDEDDDEDEDGKDT